MYKLFFLTGGFISLFIAVAGIILPVLPTTPFLLLSCFCFAKSSATFETWLRQTKMYQYYVADYAETKSISASRKKKIIWQIYLLMGISIWLAPIIWVKIGLFLLTIFITYYLFKVIPTKQFFLIISCADPNRQIILLMFGGQYIFQLPLSILVQKEPPEGL